MYCNSWFFIHRGSLYSKLVFTMGVFFFDKLFHISKVNAHSHLFQFVFLTVMGFTLTESVQPRRLPWHFVRPWWPCVDRWTLNCRFCLHQLTPFIVSCLTNALISRGTTIFVVAPCEISVQRSDYKLLCYLGPLPIGAASRRQGDNSTQSAFNESPSQMRSSPLGLS